MKRNVTLSVTSLLSVVLFSLHWADEIARGLEPGTIDAVGGFAILAVWLSAIFAFQHRLVGRILILLGAILASGVPILHMTGKGWVLGRYATNANLLFWVWTMVALGASGMLSVVLSIQDLWNRRGAKPTS